MLPAPNPDVVVHAWIPGPHAHKRPKPQPTPIRRTKNNYTRPNTTVASRSPQDRTPGTNPAASTTATADST